MDGFISFQEFPWQEIAQVQDDTSWVHVPPQFLTPAQSQDQLFQPNGPTPHEPSVSEFSILQHTVPMQDASVVPVPSLFVTPALSQNHGLQSNAPIPLRPLIREFSMCPQTFQMEDASVARVSSLFLAPVAYQDQVPRPNASMYPQPRAWEFSVEQQTVQVQDASPVHVRPQFIVPAPSQNQVLQLNAPIPPQPPVCPKCGVQFRRKQERDRHFRSHFPHSIYCPFPRCPWRSNRQDTFKEHWKKKHSNHGRTPGRHESQIYNPDPLVKSVDSGALTVETASEIALSMVGIKAKELDKVGVWESGWGRRTKTGQ